MVDLGEDVYVTWGQKQLYIHMTGIYNIIFLPGYDIDPIFLFETAVKEYIMLCT